MRSNEPADQHHNHAQRHNGVVLLLVAFQFVSIRKLFVMAETPRSRPLWVDSTPGKGVDSEEVRGVPLPNHPMRGTVTEPFEKLTRCWGSKRAPPSGQPIDSDGWGVAPNLN